MTIKISQGQVAKLTQRECDNYINKLYMLIVKTSPSLSDDSELITRLKEADAFVSQYGFQNEQVRTDFLIMNAFEPNFYKVDAMRDWLLNGAESVESEYVKYQQIRDNIMNRISGG